jgi:hypothetical protein
MKTLTHLSCVAALLTLAACDAKQPAAVIASAPAPAIAAAANMLAMCAEPARKQFALSGPIARDILEISALATDGKQATVLATVRTFAGVLQSPHADVASETMAFAGKEESKALAAGSVHEIMAAWEAAWEAAVSTTADAPDWKESAERPEAPTGLGYVTHYERAGYLLARGQARPMLCHRVYLNRTLSIIDYDGNRAAPYAAEHFNIGS